MSALRFLIPLFIGFCLHYIPCPAGLERDAWYLFAIFVATIVGFITKPMPMGAVALLGLGVAALTKIIPMHTGLLGFGSNVTWLIVFVYFIARGFIKTRLGIRISYFIIKWMGSRTLTLGYGIMLIEFLIAPLIPSNAARSGGIIYPLLTSISTALGSKVEDKTERRLGAYLAQVAAQGNSVTSAMFLTAMVANPLIQATAATMGVEITWTSWFMASCVPGFVSLLLIPLALYYLYPPQLKVISHAKTIASTHLKEMGRMSSKEYIMAFTFFAMLILWIMAKQLAIPIETTALLGVIVLLVSKILTFEDILAEKEAWHTLIWLSILIVMASTLQKLGFISWFSQLMQGCITCSNWHLSALLLLVIYFYSHYCFASNAAHVSAMYAAFVGIAISLGTPPLLAIQVFAFFSSLYGTLTHYSSAASAVIYGGGFVPVGQWCYLGFMISVLNFIIWVGVGSVWWRIIGLW